MTTEPIAVPTTPPGVTLRVHQAEALAALAAAWTAGKTRAWVALPPGAGKTLVGLKTVQDRVAAGAVGKAVVLGPNTAIQGQWAAQATALGIDVGTDRSLDHQLTALTYQALAVFDPDNEVDDDGQEVAGPEVSTSSTSGTQAPLVEPVETAAAEAPGRPPLVEPVETAAAEAPAAAPRPYPPYPSARRHCSTGCTRTAARSSSSSRPRGRCCWCSTSATTCSRCGAG